MTTLFRSKNMVWLLSFIFLVFFFLPKEAFSQESTENFVRPIPPEPELQQQLNLPTESAPGYCPSSGGSSLYESISSVDIIQQSGGNLLITVDIFIANPTGCTVGSSCPEYDNSPEYINGWIDWDGNQIFEAHERVLDEALTGYLAINYQGTMTKAVSIAIPPNAVEATWMRVNLGWAHDPNNPCEQYWTWGNVYDRQVQIKKTRVRKLDALQDVDIRDLNGNPISDPVWEEDANGNIIDNDPIAARYTGAAFKVKAYLGPIDTSWQPRTSCNWEIVGTPFSGTNANFFGWDGLISIILPQQVGIYDLRMVFTIYDEDNNVVNSGQTITRKLYLIYDTPKTTDIPKTNWLDKALGWTGHAQGEFTIISKIKDGVYENSGWSYRDTPGTWQSLVEGPRTSGNCFDFSNVWDNLSKALGISTSVQRTLGTKSKGFVTKKPTIALKPESLHGNAYPPGGTEDRWRFSMHQVGKYLFLWYYDPTMGGSWMSDINNFIQWNATSDWHWKLVGGVLQRDYQDLEGGGKVYNRGPGNHGWGKYEYIVPGGSSLETAAFNKADNAGGIADKAAVGSAGDGAIIVSCSDQGIDVNGDSIWDFLKCSIGLDVTVSGEYTITGVLASGANVITDRASVNNSTPIEHKISLDVGASQTDIHFSGEDIRQSGIDDNYTIHLILYDNNDNQIDQKNFPTASYGHKNFGEYPARFIGTPVFTTPDVNGDGLFDNLSVTIQVHAGVAGKYMVQGGLSGSGTPISNAHVSQSLSGGTSQLTLQFNGGAIRTSGINGPYTVELSLYNEEAQIDVQTHNTIAYNHTGFRDPPVEFQNFTDYGTDSDSNALYNSLTLLVSMVVNTDERYQITAWLEGQNSESIAYATWQDDLPLGLQQITIEFPGEAVHQSGIDGPYTVKYVRAVDSAGKLAASKQDAHETQAYGYTEFEASVPPLVAPTGNYTDTGIDSTGNGLFDYLTIGVEVLASDSGVIIVNGRLIDKTGEEILYTSNFGSVTAGVPEFINLNFDGRYIFGNLQDGPYYLKSLLVYHTGDPTQANWVQDAFITEFYTYDTFEPCAAITGFVKNEANKPISNVLLSLGSTDFDFTNSDGVYHLVSLTSGAYNVCLSEITGYSPDSWEIFVNGNMVGYGSSVDVNVGIGDILRVDFRQYTLPVADAGTNQTLEVGPDCMASVTLDGSGSIDPEGNSLTYSWTWDGGSAEGVSPAVQLPLGATTISLVVNDGTEDSEPDEVDITVEDTTPPATQIISPVSNQALQDGVILTADASDFCEVAEVYFYVREADGGSGSPIGYENLPSTYNGTSWECNFDTNTPQTSDGYYVILTKAVDTNGNEGWSTPVPVSIRNWAVIELLPNTANNKAGRTMPVKFALRVAAAVDPTQPFVYNEELEIRIYDKSEPDTILQTSLYGGGESTDYRIDTAEKLYITNFKTAKQLATYEVEIWRMSKNFRVGSFTFETVK